LTTRIQHAKKYAGKASVTILFTTHFSDQKRSGLTAIFLHLQQLSVGIVGLQTGYSDKFASSLQFYQQNFGTEPQKSQRQLPPPPPPPPPPPTIPNNPPPHTTTLIIKQK